MMRARLLLLAVAVTLAQGQAKDALASFNASGAGTSGARAQVLAPPTGLTVTGQSCTPTGSGYTTITYRDGAIATGAGTVTVSRPALTVAGDLLVAAYTIRDDTASIITAPTGWTQLRLDAYVGKNVQTGIWYRTAAAGDPSSWTWTSSVTTLNAIAAITAYAGATGVDASSGGWVTNAADTAPSVTVSVAGSRLVGVFSAATNVTITPPTGMTSRVQTTTAASSLQIDGEGLYTAGATGTRTATLSASKDNIGQLVALTPAVAPTAKTISYQTGATVTGGASATTTLVLPGGISTGDLLLVVYGKRKTTATITAPTGWNLQGTVVQYAGQYQQGIYWRIATSVDVAGKTYAWTTGADTNNSALALLVYRGVDQTAPVVTMTGQVNAGTGTITAASVTPSRADTRLLAVFGGQGNRTVTTGATGMTTRQNITTATPLGNAEEITLEAADQLWPEANAATGDRVVTMSGNTAGVGHLLALKAESYPLAALTWTASTSTWAGGYRLGRVVAGTETVTTELTPVSLTSYTVGSNNRLTGGVAYTMNLQTRATNWLSQTPATYTFTARSDC